jgi:hypothetical protein
MFKGKPKITKEYAQILAQKEVKKFYRDMENAGYKLTPIPEENAEQELRNFFYKQLKKEYRIKDGKFKKYIENAWETVKDGFYFTTGKTLDILDRIIGGYDEVEVKDPICPGFRTSYSRREMMESDREITQNMKLLRQRLKSGDIKKDEFKMEKKDFKTMRNDLRTYGPDFLEPPEAAV